MDKVKSFSRVFGYVRVSDKHSAKIGVSQEVQIEHIIEYKRKSLPEIQWAKESHGSDIEGFFVDAGVSAWKQGIGEIRSRPAGSAMVQAVKPGDHVLLYSIDRGFRNVTDFCNFLKYCSENDITLHLIQENLDCKKAVDKHFAVTLASAAELYSSMISFRTKEAMSIIRRKGLHYKKKKSKKDGEYEPGESCYFPITKEEKSQWTGKTYLYSRVSDSRQVDSGLSLEWQTDRLAKFATDENIPPDRVFMHQDRGVSAFSTHFKDRPEGKKIWDSLQKGDTLVAYRFDRMFRKVEHMIAACNHIKKIGARLVLIWDKIDTSDMMGMSRLNMLAWLAEQESELRSRRVHDRNNVRRRLKLPITGPSTHEKVVKTSKGTKKVVLNTNEVVRSMILVHLASQNYSWAACINLLECIRVVAENSKPNVKNFACIPYHRTHAAIVSLPIIRETLPASSWEACCEKAWEMVNLPIPPKLLSKFSIKFAREDRGIESPLAYLASQVLCDSGTAGVS